MSHIMYTSNLLLYISRNHVVTRVKDKFPDFFKSTTSASKIDFLFPILPYGRQRGSRGQSDKLTVCQREPRGSAELCVCSSLHAKCIHGPARKIVPNMQHTGICACMQVPVPELPASRVAECPFDRIARGLASFLLVPSSIFFIFYFLQFIFSAQSRDFFRNIVFLYIATHRYLFHDHVGEFEY